VLDLAARFGTPAYLFDEADFRARCRLFREAFDDATVCYAGKAFLCKAVARIVASEGLHLDVCSGGELAVAKAAGFPLDRIVLHGNNKSTVELQQALTWGVGRIVIDSVDEIGVLAAMADRFDRRPDVLLRVMLDVDTEAHAHNATGHADQKFGIPQRGGLAARAVRQVLRDGRLVLRGLHTHLGSQLVDTEVYRTAVGRAVAVLADVGRSLPELSMGGGFGIPYTEEDPSCEPRRWATALRSALVSACRDHGLSAVPRLAIEPGRALVGQAGCTLYRVGVCKRVAGARTFLSVDGGVSDNIRPALLGAAYSVTLANRQSEAPTERVRVVGKHCDAGDVIVRDAFLPADVRAGDLLAVPVTGAYCRSWSNNYNHAPRPPVVAVANGMARTIVRRETEQDLLRLDVG
jgi:diaminopimelate decarboxylase